VAWKLLKQDLFYEKVAFLIFHQEQLGKNNNNKLAFPRVVNIY